MIAMAEGKWIEDLRPDTLLPEAARHVLRVRLQVVGEYLPKAALNSEEDIEYVHQLRVATRRADAAVRIFEDCLPAKAYRQARRHLRRLRRAAGGARDWDVFLSDLQAREQAAGERQQPGLAFLIGYALGQRTAAHAALEAVYHREQPEWEEFVGQTVDSVHPPRGRPDSMTLIDLGRPLLGDLLDKLAEAAGGDLTDYGHLHQVRIAGKRLRYALEVFYCCFDETFHNTLYPRIEELQEILGRANDSHVAASRVTTLRDRLRRSCAAVWPSLQPGLEQLLRSHQRRLPQERRRFLQWWQRWHPAGTKAVLNALAEPVPQD
jgi:CHAD domain-containing protein